MNTPVKLLNYVSISKRTSSFIAHSLFKTKLWQLQRLRLFLQPFNQFRFALFFSKWGQFIPAELVIVIDPVDLFITQHTLVNQLSAQWHTRDGFWFEELLALVQCVFGHVFPIHHQGFNPNAELA